MANSAYQRMAPAANQARSASRYRPEIDGLRAFAVIAVIINHFNKNLLPSGYLGVDIFFVISGYVITSSLTGRASNGFGDFLSGFYVRRVRRLVPALVVFVLLTSLLIAVFSPNPQLALETGATSLFGLSNIFLYRRSTDYFAEATELNPFTHTWSLGVEEQFYLLFPLLIWLSGYARQNHNGARNLFVWLTALASASLIGFIILYPANQSAAYFLMPTRFWEMAAGCLIFIGFHKRARIEQALARIPPLLVIIAMAVVMMLPVATAVPATVLIVLLSALLMACLRPGTAMHGIFTNPRVVHIGLISYSLYLWHWGVLAISRSTIGVTPVTALFQLPLMLVLAEMSYRWIETPWRHKTSDGSRIWWILGGLASLALAAAGSRGLGLASNRGLLYVGHYRNEFVNVQYGMGCELAGRTPTRNWRQCLTRTNRQPSLFVLGDSHASNLVPSLEKAARKLGFARVYYLTNATDNPYLKAPNLDARDFWNGSNQFRTFARDLTASDVVVYSHSTMQDRADADAISRQLGQLGNASARSGSRLLVVDDLPATCGEIEFQRGFVFSRTGCVVTTAQAIQRRQQHTATLRSIVARIGAHYVDPLPHLCSQVCAPTRNGQLLYADTSPHFARASAAVLAPLFQQHLQHATAAAAGTGDGAAAGRLPDQPAHPHPTPGQRPLP